MVVQRSGIKHWESSKASQWECAHPSSKGRCQTNVRRGKNTFFPCVSVFQNLCEVRVFDICYNIDMVVKST